MLDCDAPGAPPEMLDEVILRVLEDFQGPITIGLRSGHVSRSNVTLTFGVEAELLVVVLQRRVAVRAVGNDFFDAVFFEDGDIFFRHF